jgi:hypothetical protein
MLLTQAKTICNDQLLRLKTMWNMVHMVTIGREEGRTQELYKHEYSLHIFYISHYVIGKHRNTTSVFSKHWVQVRRRREKDYKSKQYFSWESSTRFAWLASWNTEYRRVVYPEGRGKTDPKTSALSFAMSIRFIKYVSRHYTWFVYATKSFSYLFTQ